MNILIIHASPRRKGVTSTLLAELQAALDPVHQVESVRLHDLSIKPCIGCVKCRPDQPCVLPVDDSQVLAEKIRRADVLVIGCPNYWGNMPGALKVFFDRNVPLFEYCEARAIRYIPRPQLRGKRAVIVLSSASPFPYNLLRSQSRGTIAALKTVLQGAGVKIESVLNVADSYNFDKKRERYLKKARRIATGL